MDEFLLFSAETCGFPGVGWGRLGSGSRWLELQSLMILPWWDGMMGQGTDLCLIFLLHC